MHPHTRRKTKKRLGRLTPRNQPPMPEYNPAPPAGIPDVNGEELSHLSQDLAYFRAQRYRDVNPDGVREEDVERADAEIAALFKGRGPE